MLAGAVIAYTSTRSMLAGRLLSVFDDGTVNCRSAAAALSCRTPAAGRRRSTRRSQRPQKTPPSACVANSALIARGAERPAPQRSSQDVPRQVFVLHDVGEHLRHVRIVDRDRLLLEVGPLERNL